MKILKISGRNLASLAAEFCIDFEQEPLASSGLFAISGPTGAGKSTVLDALCLALYDATPRLLKTKKGASALPDVGNESVSVQDPRTLLRRGAAEAYAEVDFVANDTLRYRARWSVRRARGKAGGALQKSSMSLLRLHDQVALGGTNTEVAAEIVQRVGLSFEQFTRAVLLAQNEFSAFLKTEENERGELLETLTGSSVYSAISRRAFERFRHEQAALQQLGARLADHTPLAAEARTALETECAAGEAALALAEAGKQALEQQLRWHHEADKLRANESRAAEALTQARTALDQAGTRRQYLALVDAAEPARALLAECRRLEREIGTAGASATAALEAADQVRARQALAADALTTAAALLQQEESAQQQARPLLDQAKALDAAIAALAPAHAKAEAAATAADANLAQVAMALQAAAGQLSATRADQEQGAAWLAQRRDQEAVEAQWPRWDTLLLQAAQADSQATSLATELATADTGLAGAAQTAEQADLQLADLATKLAALEVTRQHAIAALGGIDTAQLHGARSALEQRRDALATADRLWAELTQVRSRAMQLQTDSQQIAAAARQAAQALAAASAAAPSLDAALVQAERSLQAAELACASSVAELRATLADGSPCPVCGSAEHPYQHQDAQLNAILASLREQVSVCRRQVQDNRSTQAAQATLVTAGDEQLASRRREATTLDASLARLAAAWAALPLAGAAPADAQDWLTAQVDALRTDSLTLDTREHAAREAARARDQAQQACDGMAAQHARLHAIADARRKALASVQSQRAALADKAASASSVRADLLAELDQAFAPGWRTEWEAAPQAWRSARAGEVTLLRERRTQQAQRATALASLEAAHAAWVERHAVAQATSSAAGVELRELAQAIEVQRVRRAELWRGRAVAEVEQSLAAAVDAARSALAARQADSQAAAQAESRAAEALLQASARLDAAGQQSILAAQALDTWLTGAPDIAGRDALDALLARERAWIGAERAALQVLEVAAQQAATVLAERSGQRAVHEATPVGGDAATLEAALLEQAGQRGAALAAASALRLQLAQDDVRRASAHAMLAEIDKQQHVEQRWARLNELIGSADGKKFRNYAQQFTLDVLLGYANAHLADLARRYRLERVVAASGPSLGLLVRDQDMGGEIRSVNSLSGGESFLVSLALALGLASLSSNRVRVESLFIDEGFGSLDSETLRVAMDALDGLQSLGRKVGVISHVQEMTERIATRILVEPAGAGTSTVSIQ